MSELQDWYDRLAEELAKECPDPDCVCKIDRSEETE